MKKLCGIIIAIMAIVLILVGGTAFKKDTMREKYPYTGISMQEFDTALMDANKVEDWELEYLVSEKDMAIEGQFIGEATLEEVAIWPEKGTNEYIVTQSLAEEFGKTFEEMVPRKEYYKLEFSLENTLYNTLDKSSVRNISIYIPKDNWEVFPDPTKYQNAILFVDDFPYGGENAVLASTLGYYYMSEEEDVYSAEKFEGLDKYSGKSREEFLESITDIQNKIVK